MAYDIEIYRAVESEYEQIREENARDLADRRARVFETVPQIEKIDDEIKSLGLKLYKIALEGGDAQEKIASLRTSQKELLAKRDTLLLEHGFEKDELSERFRCNICRDKGTVGTENCTCYKRKLILKAYEQSNLSNLLEGQNFEQFDLSLYPDTIYRDSGFSARQHMQGVLVKCKQFILGFDTTSKSLLFWGAPGLGKTFLSTCIAKELIKRGYSVIYETAYQTFSMLEDLKFGKGEDMEKLRFKADKLYSCDLLILDDLGSEFATQYTTAALFDIINSRLISGKKTLINTNLSMREISKKYTERVASRIVGHYQMLEFIGDDIRLEQSDVK